MNICGFLFALTKVEIISGNFMDFDQSPKKKKIFWHCLEIVSNYLLDSLRETYAINAEEFSGSSGNALMVDILDEIFDFDVLLNFFYRNCNRKVFRDQLFDHGFIKYLYIGLLRISKEKPVLGQKF